VNKYEQQLQRKMEHCLIFSRVTFYVTTKQSVKLLLGRHQTRKRDVIKLCSIECLTTQEELVLPTFKSWTVHHRIREYSTLGLLASF